jgi:hypothetical protein
VGPGSSVTVQRGPEGELRYQAPHDRGVHYEVYLSPERAPAFQHLRPAERRRYVQLPADLPERIRTLAQSWVKGVGDDYQRAKTIEKNLRSEFRYDLNSPSGQFDQPLDHFLFESKRGHCEYYSTAMAVMLRSLDIPSRNVTGFVGGTWNQFGKFYAVRQGDAHSWVEAYIEGRGWLTFDPTPPAAAVPQSDIEGVLATVRDFFEAISQRWNRHVLGYDLRQQVSLFESLSSRHKGTLDRMKKPNTRTLMLVTGLLATAACLYWLYRRRRRREDELGQESQRKNKDAALATSLYQLLDRVMLAMGIARGSATPPLRHALTLVRAGHPQGREVLALTQRYLLARFGDRPIETEERRDFETRVRKLKDAPREPLLTLVDPDTPLFEPPPAEEAPSSGERLTVPPERESGEVPAGATKTEPEDEVSSESSVE